MRKHLPDPSCFIGRELPGRPDLTIKKFIDKGNDACVFLGHSEKLGTGVACKLIPAENLRAHNEEEDWRNEIRKASALKNPMVVRIYDVIDWDDDFFKGSVIVAEYVNGINLKSFIKSNRDDITIPFIVSFTEALLELLHEMGARGISHGDLHLGNVLVEDLSDILLSGDAYRFRVTDFAVGETASERRFKDDFEQLADMLNNLLKVVKYEQCQPLDKYVFNVLREQFVCKLLPEHDCTREPVARDPGALYKMLKGLNGDFRRKTESNSKLISPFDFLSCEQIADSQLLRQLYSAHFLGLAEIESRNNVVVTGPRGCGKSTVFRSMSLEQKVQSDNPDDIQINYIGIYYQCSDLHFTFPRYSASHPACLGDGVDVPMHFITVTLLAKALRALESWASKQEARDWIAHEDEVVRCLWALLGIPAPNMPKGNTIASLCSKLDREREQVRDVYAYNRTKERRLYGANILLDAMTIIIEGFPFLTDVPVYFLIDDYSSPKITKDLQQNLNRVFMQRSPHVFFKIATESPVSFYPSDADGKTYVESREFAMYNLGTAYLHAKMEDKLMFIEDVFHRRLEQAVPAFPVRELSQLIGSNGEFNHNEDARGIREGRKIRHWGKETLANLCSGDIHHMIKLVGDMVTSSGGAERIRECLDEPRISETVQNQAIREQAGAFLQNLRKVPRHGDRLVDIVVAFGNVANSYIKFKTSKNEGTLPPHQASRIEPYEPLDLADEEKVLYDELLRYSVFIEDYRGKSRRGKVVPRLYLRRFLIPHFNLTFSNRDSLELEPEGFSLFLSDPDSFEKKYKKNEADDSDPECQMNFNFS